MKRKVLHVTFWSDIRHRYGSVQKIMLTLAGSAQQWSHEIACLGEVNEADFDFDGVRCHPFWENRLKNRLLNKWLRLNAFTHDAIVGVIERVRPDVLHFHNRQDKVDAVMARLSYRPGVVVHYHRDFPTPAVPRCCDRMLVPSRALATSLIAKGLPGEKVRAVSNPLTNDLLSFSAQCADDDVRVESPRPVILYGGGNFEHKGINDLLAAHRKIALDHELWLAGSGYEALENEPGVKVLGELGNREFLETIRRADVVAVPSHREAFGLVAVETMLLRRTLVVSKVGGLEEVVLPETAIQVAPNSVESLVWGLEQAIALCQQPGERNAMLTKAYQRAQEFQPDHIVAQLEAVYDEALSSHS